MLLLDSGNQTRQCLGVRRGQILAIRLRISRQQIDGVGASPDRRRHECPLAPTTGTGPAQPPVPRMTGAASGAATIESSISLRASSPSSLRMGTLVGARGEDLHRSSICGIAAVICKLSPALANVRYCALLSPSGLRDPPPAVGTGARCNSACFRHIVGCLHPHPVFCGTPANPFHAPAHGARIGSRCGNSNSTPPKGLKP